MNSKEGDIAADYIMGSLERMPRVNREKRGNESKWVKEDIILEKFLQET